MLHIQITRNYSVWNYAHAVITDKILILLSFQPTENADMFVHKLLSPKLLNKRDFGH